MTKQELIDTVTKQKLQIEALAEVVNHLVMAVNCHLNEDIESLHFTFHHNVNLDGGSYFDE